MMVIGAVVTVLFGGLFAAFLVIFAGQQAGKAMPLGQVAASAGVVVLGIVLVFILAGGALWLVSTLVRRQSRALLLKASADRTLQARSLAPVLHREVEDEPPPAGPAEAGLLELTGALDGLSAGEPQPSPAGAADEPPTRGDSQVLGDILAQLRELNENILMSDEQRRAKARLRQDKLRRKLIEEAQAAIDAADFARAGQLIEMLAEKVPGDEHVQPLQKRLDEARQAARGEQIGAVTRCVGDMMAVGAFDQAEAEARDLDLRYPNDPAVTDLLNRVRREGRMFHNERRGRMYNEVVRLAEARQWRQALKVARQYVQAFPSGAGADAVGAMLATMEDNARIEEVRELRDHIRDLLERRRYAEAVQCARDVIERFPDTRAAEDLGRQMNRLRELAQSASANGPRDP
jgi:outer membrane protein assembly factor BamD (BamD/ComL family)